MLKINDIYIKDGLISLPGKPDRELLFPEKEIYPGFCDSHTHIIQLGLKKNRLVLSNIKSKIELYERLKEHLEIKETEEITIAEDWDESELEEKAFPTKEELNKISKDRPIILRRVCGHIAVANDSALSKIPKGLERINYNTGILEEEVVLNINEIFPPSGEDIKKAIILAEDELLKLGITSIHDIMTPKYFKASQSLEKEGKLRLAIYAFINDAYIEEIKSLESTKKVRLAGIKVYTDGSIGARTAALCNFSYASGSKGLLLCSREQLERLIDYANNNGYQLAIHAIGDEAIQTVLRAMKKNPKSNPARHRIEHFELARDGQIKEAIDRNIILSMQPNFLKWSKPGGLYEMALGKDYMYNNRLYFTIREGGRITFGSDGMPYGPLLGIKEAIKAPFPSQRIGRDVAIKAYTEGGAYASFMESEVGRIEEGMKADLVVIDKEGVYMTLINGNIVYCRESEIT